MTGDWLIRTPDGWIEPYPPNCSCGSTRFSVGFTFCWCGAGPLSGGHRTWTCRECERRTVVGCAGAKPVDHSYPKRAPH